METPLAAIEMTGTVDEHHRLLNPFQVDLP